MLFYEDSHKRRREEGREDRRKGGRKGSRKCGEGQGKRRIEMEKMGLSLVNSKGKLIDLTGLYVKRLVTKRIRSKYKVFPNLLISILTLLNFMPNR